MNAVASDKRRKTRAPIAVCAWIDIKEETTSRVMNSVDLAAEGARFISMRPVAEGDAVLVRLQLEPGADPVECKGRIAWTGQLVSGLHQFAVRFLDLSEDERTQVQQLVDSYFTRAMASSLAV